MDPILFLEAAAAAAITAAVVLLLCAWPWRSPRPARTSVGTVLGMALGFYLGCWFLGVRIHWPPAEDQDRLLLLVFPAVIAVELVGAFPGRVRWLAWLLRFIVALGAAPVLLHNSIYMSEQAGPGTREWTPAQTWMILGGLGVALLCVWELLALLTRRTDGRPVPVAVSLSLACGIAAVTVMLSAYASGGQLGLPLAGALAGATLASLVLSGRPDVNGVLGLGVVGLFAVLVIGRFFGQLTTVNAALLFFGLLLCWLPEAPYIRRAGPQLRGIARVVLTAVPLGVALTLALQKSAADSARTSPDSNEGSFQDYMDFGK